MEDVRWTRGGLIGGIVFVLAALAFAAAAAHAAKAKPLLSLEAVAVNPNGPTTIRAGRVYITIERWSTPEERQRLRDTLAKQGGAALLSALQQIKPRVGYIHSTTSLAWDLYYAHEVPAANGERRIFVATDRPMSYWELSGAALSTDYAFTLAEIRLDKDGKGQGKLVPAARVTYDKSKGHIEVENYESLPVRLTDVRVVGDGKE